MQQLATETDRNNPYINCAECLLLRAFGCIASPQRRECGVVCSNPVVFLIWASAG